MVGPPWSYALLLAPLVHGVAATAWADVPGALAGDALVLFQLRPPSHQLQVGDEVDVEVIEGVPGSVARGEVIGLGTLPGTYNITVFEAPPEHRFMTDVDAESIQLRKAHPQPSPVPSSFGQAHPQPSPVPLSFGQASGGLELLFTALDSDGSGGLSREELAQAVARLVGPTAASPAASAPSAAASLPSTSALLAAAARTPEAAATPADGAVPSATTTAPATAAAAPAAPATAAAAPAKVAGAALAKALKDGALSTAKAAPRALPRGAECWINGYTRGACCDLYWGPSGDENCWDGVFTFQRCCMPEPQVVLEAQRYEEDETEKRARLAEEKRKKAASVEVETEPDRRARLAEEKRKKAVLESQRPAEVETEPDRRARLAEEKRKKAVLEAQRSAEVETEPDRRARLAEEKRKKAVPEMQRPEEVETEPDRRARLALEKRKKAEKEKRDEQMRADAEAEEKRAMKAQARKRWGEERRQKEEQQKAEEEARLEWEAKACPEAYTYAEGDIPGTDQFGHEDKLKRKTIEMCGKECSRLAACHSFEWSPTKLQCNLNKGAEPKASKNMDFIFCTKKKAISTARPRGSSGVVSSLPGEPLS